MGTSGYAPDHDDAFADIHAAFLHHANSGLTPEAASRAVRADFAAHFADPDDTHAAHFALAFAQWETGALDSALLDRVRRIVEDGADLANWRDRGAGAAALAARQAALDRFLEHIAIPRRKTGRTPGQTPGRTPGRRKPAPKDESVVRLSLPAPDGRKSLVVTEVRWDGAFINTAGMVQWADGGGAIFHAPHEGLPLAAEWQGSQTLRMRFSGISESELTFGHGPRGEAFFMGDRVALVFEFD